MGYPVFLEENKIYSLLAEKVYGNEKTVKLEFPNNFTIIAEKDQYNWNCTIDGTKPEGLEGPFYEESDDLIYFTKVYLTEDNNEVIKKVIKFSEVKEDELITGYTWEIEEQYKIELGEPKVTITRETNFIKNLASDAALSALASKQNKSFSYFEFQHKDTPVPRGLSVIQVAAEELEYGIHIDSIEVLFGDDINDLNHNYMGNIRLSIRYGQQYENYQAGDLIDLSSDTPVVNYQYAKFKFNYKYLPPHVKLWLCIEPASDDIAKISNSEDSVDYDVNAKRPISVTPYVYWKKGNNKDPRYQTDTGTLNKLYVRIQMYWSDNADNQIYYESKPYPATTPDLTKGTGNIVGLKFHTSVEKEIERTNKYNISETFVANNNTIITGAAIENRLQKIGGNLGDLYNIMPYDSYTIVSPTDNDQAADVHYFQLKSSKLDGLTNPLDTTKSYFLRSLTLKATDREDHKFGDAYLVIFLRNSDNTANEEIFVSTNKLGNVNVNDKLKFTFNNIPIIHNRIYRVYFASDIQGENLVDRAIRLYTINNTSIPEDNDIGVSYSNQIANFNKFNAYYTIELRTFKPIQTQTVSVNKIDTTQTYTIANLAEKLNALLDLINNKSLLVLNN